MNIAQLRAQQIQLLAQRLGALEKIRRGLRYTARKIAIPLDSTEHLSDAELEVLAALNERFGKLQDTLAASMKQVTVLMAEPADTFGQVLSFMAKIGIVDDITQWQNLRLLRNIGAHEYDIDPIAQAEYFTAIAEAIAPLEHMAASLIVYCQAQLPAALPTAPS